MNATHKPTALVVEDDVSQREMIVLLLEASDLKVIECESAEAAMMVLEHNRDPICLLFTDVNLAGHMTGTELAGMTAEKFPHVKIIVTSGREQTGIPERATFMPKPWKPVELIREAQAAAH